MAKLDIIKDLRSIYNNLEEKEILFESTIGSYKIKMKTYIPYEEKKVIIDGSVESGVDVDVKTILATFDTNLVRIIKEYLIIKYYTDIPVLEDILETYNLITYSGLKDFVLSHMDEKEMKEINEGIDCKISEFYRIQKLSNELGHKLEGIVASINGDLNDTISGLKNIDINDVIAKQKVISGQNDKIKKMNSKKK